MNSAADDRAILAVTRDPRLAAEFALVLEARGFEFEREQRGRQCVILVPRAAAGAAWDELDQYVRENARPRPLPPPPLSGVGWPGVIVYVALLVGLVVAVREYLFGRDWVAAGQADSAAIVGGQWWRAVTALTLHADAAHLLGNAGFGAFFGYALARSVGGGFAWLLILAAGSGGNLANAWLAGPGHLAIGASTAVFGALGVLTAYSWRTGLHAVTSRRQQIAPIIAGIGLLAFTGTAGENTDIGAHLLGFVVGFVLGGIVAFTGRPRRRSVQLACGVSAVVLVAAAWTAALVAG